MTLAPGHTFGSYEIVALLGVGGMGEVYRARDPRLGRDVAIKVLPSDFAADPERVARLTREARVLATLSHANIGAIYGIEEREGSTALVLELVEGPTMAERLATGPMPPDQAVRVALQVAEAIEAAHARGIVHRDLKPANLKITADGRAKVLDFGIAKVVADAADPAAAPQSSSATRSGVVIGTPGYMSPEQATGVAVDRRTDVWAFGCVLFEMLAGRKPFEGATPSETLVRVLEREPDWDALPRQVPPRLASVIARCLRKDARQRYQDIGDCRIELEDLQRGAQSPLPLAYFRAASRRRVPLWAGVVAVALLATGALGWVLRHWTTTSTAAPLQLVVPLPPQVELPMGTGHPVLALSPDGRELVFVGEERGVARLYRRSLASRDAAPIPLTEGAAAPFFSPDGKWVAYFDGSWLKKVALAGGVPVTLSATTNVDVNQGATWITADSVALAESRNSGLSAADVSRDARGRMSDWMPITKDTTGPYASPNAIAGTPLVLFTDNTPDKSIVSMLDRQSRSVTKVVTGGTNPLYAEPGHLMFVRGGSLFASALDLKHVRAGAESRLVDSLIAEPNGAAHVAVSNGGTLAYLAGGLVPRERELVRVDRHGSVSVLPANGREWIWPRLSPDGRRLALSATIGANLDVYVLTLDRGVVDRITTDAGEDFGAVWSPDGSRLAFSSEQFFPDEGPHAAWQAPHEGRIELLMRTQGNGRNWDFPTSWSRDGKWIAYTRIRDLRSDVELIATDTPVTSHPFAVDREAQEYGAVFSPDSRFVAYVSNESGAEEVYVEPVTRDARRVRVSTDGGTEPMWNPSGHELFYRHGAELLAVRYDVSPMEPKRPAVLFTARFDAEPYGGGQANYEVWPDGGSFIFVRRSKLPRPTTINVVVNWPAALGTSSARR